MRGSGDPRILLETHRGFHSVQEHGEETLIYDIEVVASSAKTNCKPFGGPPTLSGPWTLGLGPRGLSLELSWDDLRDTWDHLGAILNNPGTILGVSWGVLRVAWVNSEASLGQPGAILGLSWENVLATGANVTVWKRPNSSRSAPVQ